MQQIKDKSLLPKWFSREKYSQAKDLDTAGWYEQLMWRFKMLLSFSGEMWKLDEPIQIKDPYLIEELERVRAEPFSSTFLFGSVSIDYMIDDKCYIDMKVNLEIPDKVLIEQFEEMLRKVRRRALCQIDMPLEVKFKPRLDFASWVNFGVLPYIDIHIWQKENGVKVTNRLLADLIFPDGEGGEEVVRKTTAKIAQELMNGKFLKKLEVLASGVAIKEITEQNNL